MTSVLVKKLRRYWQTGWALDNAARENAREAADRIEALQALLKEAIARVPDWTTGVNEDWRERARTALKEST